MLLRAHITMVAAAFASSAHALAEDDRVVFEPLIVAVAAWVSEATGQPILVALPELRFVAPRDMPGLMGAAPPPGASGGPEVIAFYDPSAHAI